MTNIDTSRAEFEAWRVEAEFTLDTYNDPIQAMWDAWQAARAKPDHSEDKLDMVPPIEPIIVGYPLWSGLPPMMSDEEINSAFAIAGGFIGSAGEACFSGANKMREFARAILAAQSTDAMSDAGIPASNITQPLIAGKLTSK